MYVRPQRLTARLDQRGLERIYLIFGDEPQQLHEAADSVRRTARKIGVDERIVFDLDTGFDWLEPLAAVRTRSLFATRRLIEIRLGSRKPGKDGAGALVELVSSLGSDDALLVTADKLGDKDQKSRWFKALDGAGVVVQVYPLKLAELKNWLVVRAAGHGKALSLDAAELIAARVEGNLLAAAQEVEKLCLLIDRVEIDADQIISAVTDSTRFDAFGLVDSALLGDAARTVRILRGLHSEGAEAVFIGWAINRELRTLARMAGDIKRGESTASVVKKYKVWTTRVNLVRKALRRHRLPELADMLRASALIDRMVKGSATGNPWDELEHLCLRLAGTDVFGAATRHRRAG